MELHILKHQIQTNSPSNFYIFVGDEIGQMRLYWNQIASKRNLEIEWMDSLQMLLMRVSKNSLISSSKLYIIQDDRTFSSNPKLWEVVPKKLKSNILIMVYTKLDKKSKLRKLNSCVVFEKLPAETLSNHIMKIVPLSKQSAMQLAEVCELSYDRCLLEADKIKCYMNYRESCDSPITADQALRLLLSEGAIYQPIGDITFNLVEAIVSRKNPKHIETLMIQAKQIQEPPLLTLSLLYNKYRALLLVKSLGNNTEDAATKTGLNNYEVKSALYSISRYELWELESIVKGIQELEYAVKTGGIKEEMALDYFVAKFI